jgi:hypothetical protein
MAQITNGYITLEDIKTRLGIVDNNDDARLIALVNAACRWVDMFCRRRFYVSSQDETRYFTPIDYQYCRIDDLASITSLTIDTSGDRSFAQVWSATDYDLIRQSEEMPGLPYIGLRVTPLRRVTFYPRYYNSVKVIGKFGFAADSPALDIVREAVGLMVTRWHKRADAPFGVAGSGNLGQAVSISDVDPDVKQMLAPPLRKLGAL